MEAKLAQGESRQIPLNPQVKTDMPAVMLPRGPPGRSGRFREGGRRKTVEFLKDALALQ